MSAYKYISFTQDGPKASLTFNRPEVLNALNNQLIDEALDAFGRLSSDTRVLVLRGTGDKAFAAGADLEEMQHRTMWTDIDFGARRELARHLEAAPFLTVAAINGFAFGGGLELALACHLRVASDKAVLGLPETKLGILPANGGTARLTRLIGPGRALKLILLGEHIDARDAERLGIVNWVFSAAEFNDQVSALTGRLVKLAPIATRAAVDSILRGVDMTVDQAIENEHRWFQICLASRDKQEGVSAFLEKRRPNFGQG
jgi:enoyl-CoA hydratase